MQLLFSIFWRLRLCRAITSVVFKFLQYSALSTYFFLSLNLNAEYQYHWSSFSPRTNWLSNLSFLTSYPARHADWVRIGQWKAVFTTSWLKPRARSSRCLLTLRLQQLYSRRSSNYILFLFSQYLLWSNRAWFGQLKAVTLARWLIPRQAHAVFLPSPSSWSRAKASRPAISIYPSRWRILQEFSNLTTSRYIIFWRHWTPRCYSSAFAAPAILSKAAFYPSKSKFNTYHFLP